MKRITTLFASILIAVTMIVAPHAAFAAAADPNAAALCNGSGGTWNDNTHTCTNGSRTVLGTIQQITDVLVFIVSAVSVVMIIVGGFRYTISGGDQSALTSAKNTILYAIIGLVVAIMAYAIVHFVLGALGIK